MCTRSRCSRVAAEVVASEVTPVDYFPSYDIVALSDRSVVFGPDRMHLHEHVVAEIVRRMSDVYVLTRAGARGAG